MRLRPAWGTLLLALTFPLAIGTAVGADLSPDASPRGQVQEELPDYLSPTPDHSFILPEVPEPSPVSPLSAGPRVYVREIRLTGHSAFTAEELGQLTAPYTNREITIEELQALRIALTRHYIDHGYINSGAMIADQSVVDGIIEIQIVEGQLTTVELTGNRALRTGYLRGRIARGAGTPLNMTDLQEHLQLLLQDSLIKRVNGELRPGRQLGESLLDVTIEERKPYVLNVTFDNGSAPSLGGLRAKLAAGHRSLIGRGDTALYRYERTEGQTRHALSYDLPLNAYDTTFGAWIDTADSRNVEAPFNIIDIESQFDAHGAHLEHPLFRTSRHRLLLDAAFDRRTSQTSLLGIPFSFAPGVQNGRSEVSVVRLTQDWLDRSLESVFAIRSVFNLGIDAFSPTLSARGPDGRFFTWLGQAQYARRVKYGEILLRADVQLTPDPLLPLEKVAIGGATTVRGYRENQLVRDQGFDASVEFRVPVYENQKWAMRIDAAPFVDIGGAWEVDGKTPRPPVIASLGFGFRAAFSSHLRAQLYWGHALVDTQDSGGDLQDSGIHFLVTGSLFEW